MTVHAGDRIHVSGIILGISSETVRSHTKSIQRKLDCTNSASAVTRAFELGILRA